MSARPLVNERQRRSKGIRVTILARDGKVPTSLTTAARLATITTAARLASATTAALFATAATAATAAAAATVAAVATIALIVAASPVAASPAASSPVVRSVSAGIVAPAVDARRVHDLGRAAPASAVKLTVVLRYRNESELDELIGEQSDPASPAFNHVLSAAQFRSSFAPAPESYARALAVLRRAGFAVTGTFANRTVIDVQAPVSTVDRYFHTDIHRVAVAGMGTHDANVRAAVLPLELRDIVFTIAGFDDIPWFEPAVRTGGRGQPDDLTGPDVKIGKPLHGPPPWRAWGPLAFAAGYDMPVQHQIPGQAAGTTYDGSGRVAGIVNDADPSDSDLAIFLTYFRIARTGTTTRIPIDGGPQNGNGTLGVTLDYETTAGIAPGANIDIFEIPTLTTATIVDAYNAAVSQDQADTIDSGFSACEIGTDPQAFAQIFKQGTAQGQTFDAATGDDGTFAPGCSSPSVSTPADTPYTVAIGGTLLNVENNGKYFGEDYWNNGALEGAGAGGVSVVFPLPAYQQNVPKIVTTGRNMPDLSFDADSDTGEAIVIQGSWFNEGAVGGTALASAIFGGCLVEADQVAGTRLASVTKALYRNWLKQGYGPAHRPLAHDVVGGVPFDVLLVPRVGYDLATGIGSLDCYNAGQTLL